MCAVVTLSNPVEAEKEALMWEFSMEKSLGGLEDTFSTTKVPLQKEIKWFEKILKGEDIYKP